MFIDQPSGMGLLTLSIVQIEGEGGREGEREYIGFQFLWKNSSVSKVMPRSKGI